jgi:hypothetical protein
LVELLYLGSGVGLGMVTLVRRAQGVTEAETPLRRGDLPWLGLVGLNGGIIGPVLLMLGLTTTPTSSAALLLNLSGDDHRGLLVEATDQVEQDPHDANRGACQRGQNIQPTITAQEIQIAMITNRPA